jgi:hypothetical protein
MPAVMDHLPSFFFPSYFFLAGLSAHVRALEPPGRSASPASAWWRSPCSTPAALLILNCPGGVTPASRELRAAPAVSGLGGRGRGAGPPGRPGGRRPGRHGPPRPCAGWCVAARLSARGRCVAARPTRSRSSPGRSPSARVFTAAPLHRRGRSSSPACASAAGLSAHRGRWRPGRRFGRRGGLVRVRAKPGALRIAALAVLHDAVGRPRAGRDPREGELVLRAPGREPAMARPSPPLALRRSIAPARRRPRRTAPGANPRRRRGFRGDASCRWRCGRAPPFTGINENVFPSLDPPPTPLSTVRYLLSRARRGGERRSPSRRGAARRHGGSSSPCSRS